MIEDNEKASESLILFPAVDVQDGKAVQLQQGIAGSERVFGDPRDVALRWQEQGAEWIHLVDLDAAFGRGDNAAITSEIVASLDINVELSGGIRDDESLKAALATGARRINVGTAALENPDWCISIIERYGDRVAIGLDVKDGQLAARGWTHLGGDVFETVETMTHAGCERFVVTDVTSDGMLSGPNLELLGAVCARSQAKVVASGGISSLDEIRLLTGLVPIGVEGAIIGTALYVGNFTLAQALEAARPLSNL